MEITANRRDRVARRAHRWPTRFILVVSSFSPSFFLRFFLSFRIRFFLPFRSSSFKKETHLGPKLKDEEIEATITSLIR